MMRSMFIWLDRLNLRPEDHRLLVAAAPGGPAAAPLGGPFALAWRNYIKALLKKGYMFLVPTKPDVMVYIMENRTLAGKEDKTSTERQLAASWSSVSSSSITRTSFVQFCWMAQPSRWTFSPSPRSSKP